MNNLKINKKAFTLIEVIVSTTIFSIMIISIIMIYISSSDISIKSDLNRSMQENVKNVVSQISEDIKKNWILGVSDSAISSCSFPESWENYKTWDKLCTNSWNSYYLAKANPLTWDYIRVSPSECSNIWDECVIAKWLEKPLTNSFVTIKELNFSLSKDFVPKLTINLVMQASWKKWVKSELIEETKLIFQTTISERAF